MCRPFKRRWPRRWNRRAAMRWSPSAWCRPVRRRAMVTSSAAPPSALHEACAADERGNVLQGDVLAEDTHGSYVYSGSRLVATVGLRDHVVVETKDAVLVAPKDRVQDVKQLVARLKASGRNEPALH